MKEGRCGVVGVHVEEEEEEEKEEEPPFFPVSSPSSCGGDGTSSEAVDAVFGRTRPDGKDKDIPRGSACSCGGGGHRPPF